MSEQEFGLRQLIIIGSVCWSRCINESDCWDSWIWNVWGVSFGVGLEVWAQVAEELIFVVSGRRGYLDYSELGLEMRARKGASECEVCLFERRGFGNSGLFE